MRSGIVGQLEIIDVQHLDPVLQNYPPRPGPQLKDGQTGGVVDVDEMIDGRNLR